ncbi:MAG: hypothetical protein QMD46_01300 [Methanomicrobiales archaeon]|nr:hypothetical protein [Methanomicrobiales archaeon]
MEKKPCCAAEALRRVKPLSVDGKTVGIAWLEPIIEEVAALDLGGDEQIVAELVKRVKIYNYIPRSAEHAYAAAIYEEYKKYVSRDEE